MSGLVAGLRLRELGVSAAVREKGSRPGGSMLLSSGVIWRHREWSDFRRECPDGDEPLQRLVWSRLDDALDWLEAQGAEPTARETGNSLTTGRRYATAALTRVLAERTAVELESGVAEASQPLLLCSGGFGGSRELVARYIRPAAPLMLRANPWSAGDGLRIGLARGAALSEGLDEFYGRNMPDAPLEEHEFVSRSQLYARFARIVDEDGVEFFDRADVSWSETNVVRATAQRPHARAYYLLDEPALAERVRGRPVAELVDAAPAEARVPLDGLPFPSPDGTVAAVRVAASVTHTIGGLRIDERARVLDDAGRAVPGLWAAGVDAGGVATGGYASGLAQALVLGLAAAEDIAASC